MIAYIKENWRMLAAMVLNLCIYFTCTYSGMEILPTMMVLVMAFGMCMLAMNDGFRTAMAYADKALDKIRADTDARLQAHADMVEGMFNRGNTDV